MLPSLAGPPPAFRAFRPVGSLTARIAGRCVWLRVPLGLGLGSFLSFQLLAWLGWALVPVNADLPVVATRASQLFGPAVRWDAVAVVAGALAIDRSGPLAGAQAAVVPPLDPALIAAIARITPGSPDAAAVAISGVCFVAALVLLDRVLARRVGPDLAGRAGVWLVAFPYAFLFWTAYPLALALLLATLGFTLAERGPRWLAGLVAAAAGLVGPVGLALWAALVAGALPGRADGGGRTRGDLARHLAGEVIALGALPLALVGLGYRWSGPAGPGLASFVRLVLAVPPDTGDAPSWARLFHAGGAGSARADLLLALNLALGLAVLLTTPRVDRRLGRPYAVYQVALVLLGAAANPAGLGTTAALAFPAFVALATIPPNDLAESLILATSAGALGLLVVAFVAWYPIGGARPFPTERVFFRQIQTTFDREFRRTAADPTVPSPVWLTLDDSVLVLDDLPPAPRYAPGQTVALPLYLYVLQSTDRGYLLSARLQDSAGQVVAQANKTLWGTADQTLFDPGQPPQLHTGRFLQENLALPLPTSLPAGRYSLSVDAFAQPSFARLPLVRPDGAGDGQIAFGGLIIAAPQDLGPPDSLPVGHLLHAMLGDALALRGYSTQWIETPGGLVLRVTLVWEALQPPADDYTVFVQLLDQGGKLITQSNSYPANGNFPTRALRPGQALRDVHQLDVPAAARGRPGRLIVGMYRLATMQRLPVRLAGGGAVADHVDLGAVVPPARR